MKIQLIDGGGVSDCAEITHDDGTVTRQELSPAQYFIAGLLIGLQEEVTELISKLKVK